MTNVTLKALRMWRKLLINLNNHDTVMDMVQYAESKNLHHGLCFSHMQPSPEVLSIFDNVYQFNAWSSKIHDMVPQIVLHRPISDGMQPHQAHLAKTISQSSYWTESEKVRKEVIQPRIDALNIMIEAVLKEKSIEQLCLEKWHPHRLCRLNNTRYRVSASSQF